MEDTEFDGGVFADMSDEEFSEFSVAMHKGVKVLQQRLQIEDLLLRRKGDNRAEAEVEYFDQAAAKWNL